MESVLVAGGTGLVGMRLTQLLLAKGHVVSYLGRTAGSATVESVKCFRWDIKNNFIEPDAFKNVTSIVHLAGANLADERWNEKRKQEILDSRVKAGEMIYNFLKSSRGNHQIRNYISASAIGYYGDCGAKVLDESSPPGTGFLATVCREWEGAAVKIGSIGIKETRFRIGIVLARNGGAMPGLTKTLPFGFAAYFVKPNLYYSWIHIDDICGMIIHALENRGVAGAYNATAPEPLLMKDLMKEIIKSKKSGALLIPVPSIALKMMMGEMSDMLLGSQRCSSDKIVHAGFSFKFADIGHAIANVL